MNRPPTENENGFALSPVILSRAVILAGLTWAMPPAQIMSVQIINHNLDTADPAYVPDEEMLKMLIRTHTLMGIPVGIDTTLNESVVELRLNGTVIWRIDGLAIPCMFETWREETNHGKEKES